MSNVPRDPWVQLGATTPARIATGRAGVSLPTRAVLSFALAHARARDAVHAQLDRVALANRLHGLGLGTVDVASEARDRATYLRRPDLGRRLGPASSGQRAARVSGGPSDLAIVIGDGLSAT